MCVVEISTDWFVELELEVRVLLLLSYILVLLTLLLTRDTCICETIPCIYGVSSRQLVLERRTALILYDATLGRVGGNKVRSLLLCCCLTR